MKRAFIVFFAVLFVLSSFSFSVAEGTEGKSSLMVEERYIGLSRATTNLSLSNNTANCKAVAYAKTSGYTLYVTLSLQKKSGTSWNYVTSWIGVGSGFSGVVLNKTKSGLTSGTYRCKAYVRVYDSNGSYVESTTVYSQSITI